jgi:hypothetical protein
VDIASLSDVPANDKVMITGALVGRLGAGAEHRAFRGRLMEWAFDPDLGGLWIQCQETSPQMQQPAWYHLGTASKAYRSSQRYRTLNDRYIIFSVAKYLH